MRGDLANIRVAADFLSRTEIKFDMVSAVDELRKQIGAGRAGGRAGGQAGGRSGHAGGVAAWLGPGAGTLWDPPGACSWDPVGHC